MRLSLVLGVILATASGPGTAGPWPRGEGNTFLALSYEATVERDDPLLELSQEAVFYGEHGLAPRLTFVLDGSAEITGEVRSLVAYANRSLADPGATHQFAAGLGYGFTRDRAGSGSYPVLAASWGRGFDTRWGGGWTTVEAQYRAASGDRALAKLDATVGIRPNETGLVYGQIQIADSPGSDITARLTATMVFDLTKVVKAEVALLYGIANDETAGVRSGLWLDF